MTSSGGKGDVSDSTPDARIAQTVEHVAVPYNVRTWHPTIDRLLKEDEKHREKQLSDPHPMSWNKPLFDTPFERRRLRILNSLFLAVARMNGKPSVYGRDAREIRISFFQQHIQLTLDRPKRSHRHAQVLNTTGESVRCSKCHRWHHLLDFVVDAFSPVIPLFRRRASTFCKAPLKKSSSMLFSASNV
jgi:hypothetical protein